MTSPSNLIEGILGDLEEYYQDQKDHNGSFKARWSLWWATLRFIHPYLLFRKEVNSKSVSMGLLKNHLLVTWRSLGRNKFYSSVNLFGLSLSMALVFLSYFFIQNERAFDHFHGNSNRLYRVVTFRVDSEGTPTRENKSGVVPMPVAPILRDKVTGIKAFSRFGTNSATVFKKDTPFEEVVAFADPSFLTMFDFDLLQGNKKTALEDPSSILISPEIAEKYFGDTDPLEQSIKLILNDSAKTFIVKGVVDDLRKHSSIRFDILIPFQRMEMVTSAKTMQSMRVAFTESYILFDNPVSDGISETLTAAVEDTPAPDGTRWIIDLQPLTEIHLDPQIQGIATVINPQKLWVLSTLCFLVISIAIINFITLSTGQAMTRTKEIGLRKTLGAYRNILRRQLIAEAIFFSFVAAAFGVVLAMIFRPLFDQYLDGNVMINPKFTDILFVLGVAVLIGLISGALQSRLIINFSPIAALSGKKLFSSRMSWMNQGLIIIQFSLAILLVIGTVVIRQQMSFIQEKDLGYNEERLVEINLFSADNPETSQLLVDRFKAEILSHPQIISVGATMNNFQDPWTELSFRQSDDSNENLFYNQIDTEYLQTLGISIVEGEGFREGRSMSSKSILVNQALVDHFGWDDPLSMQIPGKNFSEAHEIIGVVEDFHFNSLHNEIEPLILALDDDPIASGITGLNTYVWPSMLNRLVIRIGPGELQEVLEFLEEKSLLVNPSKPFAYQFADDLLAKNYENETRWNKVMNGSATFSLIIAWMGLLGLTRLSVRKRVKEIGIRKVLGSTTYQVTSLLSRRFFILVLVANLLAWPLAWIAINRWLSSFAYRVEPSMLLFALSGLGVLLVALSSVGIQAFRAAAANPANAIKYE